jgi:hypothetical protein
MPSHKNLVVLAVAVGAQLVAATAAMATTWDLRADWSNTSNPNGPWEFLQGVGALPAQSDVAGFGPGFAPGVVAGNFLPFWVQASGDDATTGYLTGDILVHSVDPFNGNPALGETSVSWTSPISGVIDVAGELWYAHNPQVRSNDFELRLNSTLIASGIVGSTSGYDRANPLAFGATGLTVSQGDVVSLILRSGQAAGAINGVNLTITPEPESLALLSAAAVALLASWRRSRGILR